MRRWTTRRSRVWFAGTRVPPEYADALRSYAALAERDDDTIHARGGSMLLAHGRPTARAVVFLHGLTASPMQCDALARRLHANGDTVIIPRLPGHGARDRLTTQLRDLRSTSASTTSSRSRRSWA
jgi:alpha-beta hydrolase superfamily lysophospholipase